MNTQREIKLKDGSTLPKGLPVTFDTTAPWICTVDGRRVRVSSAFPRPDQEELEEMSNDGVCVSVAGHQVEPDGWDSHGSPSWLLALGMI